MPKSLAPRPSSTHVNSSPRQLMIGPLEIEPRMAKAAIDVNSAELPKELDPADEALSLVFATFDAIGLTDKEAAYAMGIDPAALSRAKQKQGKLSIDALWRLPQAFWLEYQRRTAEAKHLTAENEEREYAENIGRLVTSLLTYRIARRRSEVA